MDNLYKIIQIIPDLFIYIYFICHFKLLFNQIWVIYAIQEKKICIMQKKNYMCCIYDVLVGTIYGFFSSIPPNTCRVVISGCIPQDEHWIKSFFTQDPQLLHQPLWIKAKGSGWGVHPVLNIHWFLLSGAIIQKKEENCQKKKNTDPDSEEEKSTYSWTAYFYDSLTVQSTVALIVVVHQ